MKTHAQPSANAAWSAGFVAFFVVVTSLMVTASALSGTKKIDPKNFKILGISLGSSSIEDVKRILGPAPEWPSTDGQNTVMCYASPGNDRTILEFEIWTDPIEFRLFQGSTQEATVCLVAQDFRLTFHDQRLETGDDSTPSHHDLGPSS